MRGATCGARTGERVKIRREFRCLSRGVSAVILLLATPLLVTAHSPTGGDREYSPDNAAEVFWFGSGTSALTWFITEIEPALESHWNTSNNTRAPHFTRTSVDGAQVKFLLNSQVPNTTECPSTFWYACTDYVGVAKTSWNSTTFNSADPAGSAVSYWCGAPNQADSGCVDAGRVALHEVGHGVGLARQSNGDVHQSDSASAATTVMQTNPIFATNSGWATEALGTCDLIELAREYDVVNFTLALPACVDHIAAPATTGGKVVSDAVQTTTLTGACVGSGVTLSGSLKLTSQPADDQLGLLAGNGLGTRTIEIFRRTSSTTYPVSAFATTTTSSTSTGAWSISVTSGIAGTWIFKAHFSAAGADLLTLQPDDSLERTITWSTPC